MITEQEDFWDFDLTNGLDGKGNSKDTGVEGYTNEWATAGFFGRLNYDYLGRYLFEVNMRYDGTSRFRRGSRWQLSPSFSAGWNIAQEEFFAPVNHIVDQLKLRFSYGELGNQNTNSWYPTYRVMDLGALNGDWIQNGARPNTASVGSLISTSLTWEKVRTWDVGLIMVFSIIACQDHLITLSVILRIWWDLQNNCPIRWGWMCRRRITVI